MTTGFPASASPPKSSAPAFARSTPPARTPALPPAAGRARFGFAACDPYFPILRGPALRTPQGARTHPSGAAFLFLVRGLLSSSQEGGRLLHSIKGSAAFCIFVAQLFDSWRICAIEDLPLLRDAA